MGRRQGAPLGEIRPRGPAISLQRKGEGEVIRGVWGKSVTQKPSWDVKKRPRWLQRLLPVGPRRTPRNPARPRSSQKNPEHRAAAEDGSRGFVLTLPSKSVSTALTSARRSPELNKVRGSAYGLVDRLPGGGKRQYRRQLRSTPLGAGAGGVSPASGPVLSLCNRAWSCPPKCRHLHRAAINSVLLGPCPISQSQAKPPPFEESVGTLPPE